MPCRSRVTNVVRLSLATTAGVSYLFLSIVVLHPSRFPATFTLIVLLVDLLLVDMTILGSAGRIRHREATNPRDKIYGMMRLGGHNITNLVRPDYSLTLLHVTKNLRGLSHLNP